jgi:hypothetical protein
MLAIFMLISVATTFARIAHDKDFNRFIWGAIGVSSYFIMQVVVGIIVIITMPKLYENTGAKIALDLGSGLLGVSIAYFILKNLHNPNDTPPPASGDLLDSDL